MCVLYPIVTLGPWHTGVCPVYTYAIRWYPSVYPGIPSPVGGKVRRSQYGQGTVTIVARPAYELRHIRTVHIDTKIATRPSMGDCGTQTRTTAGAAVGMLKMRVAVLTQPRGAVWRPAGRPSPARSASLRRRLRGPGRGRGPEKRPMDLRVGPCALGVSCTSRVDFEPRVLKLTRNLKLSMPPALAG